MTAQPLTRPDTAPVANEGDSMLAAVLSDPERLAAVPIETLERLIALRERMEAEAARRAFFDALSDFQRLCPSVQRGRGVNDRSGKLMYRFAPLEDIVEAIRETEHDCGFSHRFETAPDEQGGAAVTCIVTHRLGHSEQTTVQMPATKGLNTNASQDRGIVIKYGMRYALIGAFGIVTADRDTDARMPEPENVEPITEEQALDIAALISETKADTVKFCAYFKVADVGELPAARYGEAVQMLERKRK